jgi:FKBP-type peptidyl-prolyl cis-trans isomerase
MRRLFAALLAPVAVTAVLAGCSSSPSPAAGTNNAVKVTGTASTAPTISIPAKPASKNLVTRTLIAGHGAKLTADDSYLANFDIYVWHGKTSKQLISTYKSTPQVLPVTMGLTGLQQALAGQRVGARVLAVLPPKYAYGSKGNSEIGVTGSDTMVWVVDLLKEFPPDASAVGQHVTDGGGKLPTVSTTPGTTTAPSVEIPKNSPPSKLVVTTLIRGSGATIQKDQSIVVRYEGVIWRTGKTFNTNWPSATEPTLPPNVFTLGQLIPAWNTGLIGQKVGSRVMLVVPPAEGYGTKGSPQVGIKGTDTLVFVVDILAVA